MEVPLTMADLPPKDTKRWVIRRKAEVVAAVRGGLLSLEEACDRYKLTVDEFLSWQRSIDRHGLPGLRATRIQTTESRAPSQRAPLAAWLGARFAWWLLCGRLSPTAGGKLARSCASARLLWPTSPRHAP